MVIFVLQFFFSAFLTYSKADPCENYSPLPFPHDRYVTNNISGSEVSVLHDRHLERAWYRAGHALDMATTAPSLLQCGTTFPVWMNGRNSPVNVFTLTCFKSNSRCSLLLIWEFLVTFENWELHVLILLKIIVLYMYI